MDEPTTAGVGARPVQVSVDRRGRELEGEVERLKRLVAELMLDKQRLQDIAKKSLALASWCAIRGGHITMGEMFSG